MKRTLIGLVISSMLVLPAFAIKDDNEYLDWMTFCPMKYASSSYQQTNPLLFFLPSQKEKKRGNYWLVRRKKFYTSLNICKDMQGSDARLNCYMKLRELEDNLNSAPYILNFDN
jgi:hypothetical protein